MPHRNGDEQRRLPQVTHRFRENSSDSRSPMHRQFAASFPYDWRGVAGNFMIDAACSSHPGGRMKAGFGRREVLQQLIALGGAAHFARRGIGADTPSKPRIKIGQIGVGHAHAGKLSVFRASPDFDVVGIVEPDEELRKKAESQAAFRDLPWMTQEQLLNVGGLQAVLVETRVRDLLDTAEACLAAGKHIHLDKPAGVSLPQFRKVLDAAAKQKRLVQMGYMYRYNPGVVLLRKFLKEGWLGDVFEVHAVMSKVVPPVDRLKFAEFKGGVMFDLGGHIVDLVVGVLGQPQSVTPFNQHSSTIQDPLADNMLSVLAYPRATATIRSSALEVEGFGRRHLTVCGTEGTFHIQPLDDPSATISLSQSREGYKAGTQNVVFPKYTRYVDDAADMAKIIRGEKQPDFSAEHDFAVQATLLQACEMPVD
jgi:predicted dehydrogenase